MAVGRAGRAISPLTKETLRDSGEIVREFDLRSAASVLGASIGVIFLIFFLAAFVPWLLANGMTAAVEGMMHQVGFGDFSANTLGDWILVLFIGAVFTAFIVALAVAILYLYNVLSQRTGMGLRVVTELPPPKEQPPVIEAPAPAPAPAPVPVPVPEKGSTTDEKPSAAAGKSNGAAKRKSTTTKRSGTTKRT